MSCEFWHLIGEYHFLFSISNDLFLGIHLNPAATDLRQHSILIGKVHLPFSNQSTLSSSTCFFHVLFGLPFFLRPPFLPSASLSSFGLQHQNLILFSRHDRPLSSTHDHTSEHCCHSQMIYGFTHTQHELQICRSFSIFELFFAHCSHHEFICPSYNSDLSFLQVPYFTHERLCRIYCERYEKVSHKLERLQLSMKDQVSIS